MKITKIFHSCILLEDKRAKILIDPGAWVFEQKAAKVSDFSDADAVLITHEHPDHYYPEALRELAKNGARIVTNKELAAKMADIGIRAETIEQDQRIDVKGIPIVGVHCPHGSLPFPAPDNIGFKIDGKIFHPGDNASVRGLRDIEVLFVPVAGPWVKVVEAVMLAKTLRPKIAVPIHDGMITDFFVQRLRETIFGQPASEWGIEVKAANPGESFEI